MIQDDVQHSIVAPVATGYVQSAGEELLADIEDAVTQRDRIDHVVSSLKREMFESLAVVLWLFCCLIVFIGTLFLHDGIPLHLRELIPSVAVLASFILYHEYARFQECRAQRRSLLLLLFRLNDAISFAHQAASGVFVTNGAPSPYA